MTALQLRLAGGQATALTGALVMAVAVGAGAAYRPEAAAAVTLAAVVVVAVASIPTLGPVLVLASALLVAGVERDTLLPVLRPHEAVLLLVAAGLVLRLALQAGWRDIPRFRDVDAVVVLLATAGTVLPLLWMVIRERPIETDDLFYALQLWKYATVYAIVRLTIRDAAEVRRMLWLIVVVAVPLAIVGIMQSLRLFGLPELIETYYAPGEEVIAISRDRATATLGSPFAVADVMVFSLAIAGGLLVRGARQGWTLIACCVLFVFGTFAAGQVSGLIGIVVAVVLFGWVTRRLGRALLAFSAVAVMAVVALQPVIEARLNRFDTASGLPPSWSTRLENLQTYFWPPLGEDWNWVTGVRPSARVTAPETGREWVYIESGHTWLLWTGGVIFAIAFLGFLAVSLTRMLRIARERRDAIGVAAIASFTALGVIGILMTLDPHLTLRGSAEVTFTLLALALTRGSPP